MDRWLGDDDRFPPSHIIVAVVKATYNYPHRDIVVTLEDALDAKSEVIVIESTQVGDETVRWINYGIGLHKTAVITGAVSIVTNIFWPEHPFIWIHFSSFSLICTGLYTAFWQFNDCVKYEIEKDPAEIEYILSLEEVSAVAPVVLVRNDNTKPKVLQWIFTLSAVALCAFRLFKNSK